MYFFIKILSFIIIIKILLLKIGKFYITILKRGFIVSIVYYNKIIIYNKYSVIILNK